MKKTGVRKAQTPPFFRPDDCAKTGRKPTCRRGAGNETCGCRTKQERPLQPQIALSPRFTERLHDRPGNFVPHGERPHRFQFQLNQGPHILTVQDLAPALPLQPGELFPSRLSHIPAANRKEN